MGDGLASPFTTAKRRAGWAAVHAVVIARQSGRSGNRQRCCGYWIISFRGWWRP